jgi:hypothetical protein
MSNSTGLDSIAHRSCPNSLVSRKDFLTSLKLPLNRAPFLLPSHRNASLVILNTMHETLRAPRLCTDIIHALLFLPKFKRPKQLRNRNPEIAFRKMYSGANAATSPIPKMISIHTLLRRRIVGRQLRVTGVALWNEMFWGAKLLGVHMHPPNI